MGLGSLVFAGVVVVPEDFGVGVVSGIFGGLAEPVGASGLVAGVPEAFGVGVAAPGVVRRGCYRRRGRGSRSSRGGRRGDRDDRRVRFGSASFIQRGIGGRGRAEHEDRRGGEDHRGRTPARTARVEASGRAGAALQAPVLAGRPSARRISRRSVPEQRAWRRATRAPRLAAWRRVPRRTAARGLRQPADRRAMCSQAVDSTSSGIYLGAAGPPGTISRPVGRRRSSSSSCQ